MTEHIVKSKWRLNSIEYSGLGNSPQFILMNDAGEVKIVPLEKGVHNLRTLLGLEEE
jgi:hypothetical protein|tara:strand:+ start:173 stop:343 length:171 start_codon:yes stop_codon:yes gene_type:complete